MQWIRGGNYFPKKFHRSEQDSNPQSIAWCDEKVGDRNRLTTRLPLHSGNAPGVPSRNPPVVPSENPSEESSEYCPKVISRSPSGVSVVKFGISREVISLNIVGDHHRYSPGVLWKSYLQKNFPGNSPEVPYRNPAAVPEGIP